MGIDYGSKRVGVALSDERGEFALPYAVVQNDSGLVKKIEELCVHNDVSTIVIGESKDYTGKENPIMQDIREFIGVLSLEIPHIRIELEPEFMTSVEAERTVFRRGDTTVKRAGERGATVRNEMLDASAAALILKHFLERNHERE